MEDKNRFTKGMEREKVLGYVNEVRDSIQGETTLFDSFKRNVLDKHLEPTDVFLIAQQCYPTDTTPAIGIFLLYKTLGLNQENAIEKLRPFLENTRWSDRQTATQLIVAEDMCDLPRNFLYKPISGRND